MKHGLARMRQFHRRFVEDIRAVAALEFALIAPMLLILYMGGTEASLAVTLHRKLGDTAGTISDLATQNNALTKAELNGLTNVARDIMRPYDVSALGLSVIGVDIATDGKAKVVWSYGQNGSTPARGSPYALGADYASVRDAFVVVTSARYTYRPLGGYGFKQSIDMVQDAIFRARSKTGVRCDDC